MNTEQLKTGSESIAKKIISVPDNKPEHAADHKLKEITEIVYYFASQESKRAVDEALIDKDFIVYCLNQAWNYAHEQLQKKDLGDIEREIYQQQKDKAKALMTKLDS